MTEQPHQTPDPAAIYSHIYNRLRQCQAMGEKMPVAERSQSFAQLMVACSALIAENDRLRRQVAIAQTITEELEIDLTIRDIEIFNFTNHSEQKDE